MGLDRLALRCNTGKSLSSRSSMATGCNRISLGRIAAPKSMIVRDGLVSPGQIMQILPSWASSAAQILTQFADSSGCACDSSVPGGLHIIHSPLSSIGGNNSQIASLRSMCNVSACTLRNQASQQIFTQMSEAHDVSGGCSK